MRELAILDASRAKGCCPCLTAMTLADELFTAQDEVNRLRRELDAAKAETDTQDGNSINSSGGAGVDKCPAPPFSEEKRMELLSPAGNREALVAAIACGADAVYLGYTAFGARSYAGNFDADGLARRCRAYAHERGRKIYVTVNTLVKQCETG